MPFLSLVSLTFDFDIDIETRPSEKPNTSFVWIWSKSVQRFSRYFIHKQNKSQTAPKQNLTQFTACGKAKKAYLSPPPAWIYLPFAYRDVVSRLLRHWNWKLSPTRFTPQTLWNSAVSSRWRRRCELGISHDEQSVTHKRKRNESQPCNISARITVSNWVQTIDRISSEFLRNAAICYRFSDADRAVGHVCARLDNNVCIKDFWPRYLTFWFILTLSRSCSKVDVLGQSSRLHKKRTAKQLLGWLTVAKADLNLKL